MKHLHIFILLITLSGCYSAPDPLKPMSWLFKQMPQDAPNNYKRGWKDGCETGMSSMTNTFYKTFYSFKQDKKLRTDPVYYTAWKDSSTFCRHYVYGTIRQSDVRMNLPNKQSDVQETFMGARGILDSGMLQLLGPGDALLPFQQFGTLGGSGAWPMDIGGQSGLDYSGESAISGVDATMTWDFNK
jgi:hypothetical protein